LEIQIQQFENPKITILRRFDLLFLPKKLLIKVKLSLNTLTINQTIEIHLMTEHDEVFAVINNTMEYLFWYSVELVVGIYNCPWTSTWNNPKFPKFPVRCYLLC